MILGPVRVAVFGTGDPWGGRDAGARGYLLLRWEVQHATRRRWACLDGWGDGSEERSYPPPNSTIARPVISPRSSVPTISLIESSEEYRRVIIASSGRRPSRYQRR